MKKDEYKFVSIEGCKLIGHGKHGKTYQLNEEQIIKVYIDDSSLDIIEREYALSKKAFVLGVPTAITFGTVKTEMGYGIIYESAGIMPLGLYIQEHPDKLEECAEKFADALITLNSIHSEDYTFNSVQDWYIEHINSISRKYLSQKDIDCLIRIIKAIPVKTNFLHTDYHTQNVMINDQQENLVIDMADVGYGNPLFDIGSTYMTMNKMPRTNKKQSMDVSGLSPENSLKVWDIVIRKYLKTDDPQKIKEFEKKCEFFSNVRMAVVLSFSIDLTEFEKRIISWLVKWNVVRNEKRYIEAMKQDEFSF